MSLYIPKIVSLSALSAILLITAVPAQAQIRNQPLRYEGKISEQFHGIIDSWKPKDARTRVDFWYKNMHRADTVEYYTNREGYVNRSLSVYEPEVVYPAQPVYYKGRSRVTVIEADIPGFERRRPVPYRRYR